MALLTGPAFTGCASWGPTRPQPDLRVSTAEVDPRWRTIGTSVEGRPIRAWIDGTGPHTSLFVGGMHGDEPSGTDLLESFVVYLEKHPETLQGQRVLIVPAANPDGLAAGTRTNAHDIDLNRNFPTANYRRGGRRGSLPASEPEVRALNRLIASEKPAFVLAVHAPLGCVDYDGPAADLAERLSRASGLKLRKIGAQPGSLGSLMGEDEHIPTVTLRAGKAYAEHRREQPTQSLPEPEPAGAK